MDPNAANAGQPKEDYVDKGTLLVITHPTFSPTRTEHLLTISTTAMDFGEKKAGQDPNKMRSVNEKVVCRR